MQLDEVMKNKRIQEAIAEQQSIETANFFKNEDRIGSDYNIDDHAEDHFDVVSSKSAERQQSNEKHMF